MLQKMNRRACRAATITIPIWRRGSARFELAFRMQIKAPEAFEVEKESRGDQEAVRPGQSRSRAISAGSACSPGGSPSAACASCSASHSYWDQHVELCRSCIRKNAPEVDQPIAGLLKDMKARGLFKDTLVIWGGEFGRTPWAQSADGRDHNPYGYTMWMAGAGVKPGFIYGATDEFGYHAVENRMHIHDLHATSCTCWDSITRSSRTATPAATSA